MTDLNVSRETQERLEAYVGLLLKWNKRINLIGSTTESDIWDRHVVDSAQLRGWIKPEIKQWVDIGSGGGLPGIVVAILSMEYQPETKVKLIESDQRKCAFLRSVVAELKLTATVMSSRAETAPHQEANVLSARAVGPITRLLPFAKRHLRANGVFLLPKGRQFQRELDDAHKRWNFDVVAHPSITDKEAKILEIRNIEGPND